MNTTFTLMQAAIILSIPMQQAARLVRQGVLKAAKRADKVYTVDAMELQAFINRSKQV